MKSTRGFPFVVSTIAAVLIGGLSLALASIPAQIGPYRVRIATNPGVIPVGMARLTIHVTDAGGKPVEGAEIRSLVQMPTMAMGEKEVLARPLAGKPGSYTTEASFAMAGSFEASIAISGPLGDASGKVAMATGQDAGEGTDASSGLSIRALLPWVIVAFLAAFVLFRMRRTGQRLAWRSAVNRETVSGVLLLVVILGFSLYAIRYWRRPGAMTPLEAQSMQMNTPAPPGTAAVTLAEATLGPIGSADGYSGQAAAFNEQDVMARTEGWLTWMPFYNGQRVHADEVVARLDTSQILAHLAESEAGVNMASQGVNVTEREHRQSLADADRMRAELRVKQSTIADAEAMLGAANADRQFWQQQDTRNKTLLDKGALSIEEYQRDSAMSANAEAKFRQAQARLAEVQGGVKAAEAAVRAAEAMVEVAQAKIGEAEAGVRQAREHVNVVHTTHAYTEIRSQIDGVVTQRLIAPGQLVNPGQAILRIAQVDPIRLQASVAEADLGKIKVGNHVVVRSQGNAQASVDATVTSIGPTVDPTTRTAIVEAVASNRQGVFLPGQSITIDISTATIADAVRVPLASIRTRAQAGPGTLAGVPVRYVWVADANSADGLYAVKTVDVQTGVSDGVNIQIVSGLQAGQKVVVSGADYLKVGDTVSAGTAGDDTGGAR